MQSYEGGTATPLIIHWPDGLKGKENTINKSFAHVIDILPTCLELAGANYPETINGMKTIPPVGNSMMPVLMGKSNTTHDTIYWEHERGKAIRTGDWKMSAMPGKNWELFNIEKDHTETNDLSSQYPEKVAQMNGAWEIWAKNLAIRHE
jgi:arylsulfatase